MFLRPHAGPHAGSMGRSDSASTEQDFLHEMNDDLPAEATHTDTAQDAAGTLSKDSPANARHQHANAQGVLTNTSPLSTAKSLTQRKTAHLSPVAPLHIRTDLDGPTAAGASMSKDTPTISYNMSSIADAASHQSMMSPTEQLPVTSSSLRSNLSASSLASSLSPGSGSALPSPYLASMTDLTPLPSPLMPSDQSAKWRSDGLHTHNRSRGGSLDGSRSARSSSLPPLQTSPSRRKKAYGSLMQEAAIANAAHAHNSTALQENGKTSAHSRNRSISDFVPEQLQNVRPRVVTFGPGDAPSIEAAGYQMHRESYLAEQRGLSASAADNMNQVPTPPPSNSSAMDIEDAEEEQPYLEDGSASEYLEIHCGIHNKRRKFRQLRQLGRGTFSSVMLATRERIPAHPTPEIEEHLDPHKLVAVKIVEHGPAGGADEERIEISLKREVEMLKSVSHPSLVHLKACEYQETRTLLVLTYCPGGDLFEFASQKRDLLTPSLIQRMFAELVHAVRYLHRHWIVHRDIKLENVLVNIPESSIRSLHEPESHPTPIVTLTDMGLSRRIPEPPESPLLTTRCGSEDYAAPEILLGQPYDGRLTDGWALGVLLFALMEGRLPFDAPPGRPDRSRNTHRIARCDWIWCRFGDEDGEWDAVRGKDFEGARPCVEGLLKKVRMGRKNLEEIETMEWVQQGIRVEGGLKMRQEDDDSDLL